MVSRREWLTPLPLLSGYVAFRDGMQENKIDISTIVVYCTNMKSNINTIKIDYVPSIHDIAVRLLGMTEAQELALEKVDV